MSRRFLSGNEAVAHGVRLARPQVISAYPITPQTIVVERLSEMIEEGQFKSEFIHVESEHSALSCAIGASAVGARAFTATSSQGLLYMAECLPYAAGGRFPIVMMNANRSTALPWNIYGDQRDSLSQLDCGWIQAYAKDAQEALDLTLLAYYVAEHKEVSTPVMVNLDGFHLTHTYEIVDVPDEDAADAFLPPFITENKLDFQFPKNLAFSAGAEHNLVFKYKAHKAMLRAKKVIQEAEERFRTIVGRKYSGLVDPYLCEDADYILITLGSIAGICKNAVDGLRKEGIKAGVLRLRYLRPFPGEEIAEHIKQAKAVGVLEKDISFGNEGTVYTNVNSALHQHRIDSVCHNFVAGLGGKDISPKDIERIFYQIQTEKSPSVTFVGIGEE